MGTEHRAYEFKAGRSNIYKKYVELNGKPMVEIIYQNLTRDEASVIERTLIKQLGRKSLNEGNLLNLSSGGQKGALGYKQSDETKAKKSKAMQGKKIHSEEQKLKWSKERKGKSTNWDPNHIKSDKGRPKPNGFKGKGDTPVLQFDLDGNFIKEWSSQKEVYKKLGIRSASIWSNIKGHTKKAGGFVWKYK